MWSCVMTYEQTKLITGYPGGHVLISIFIVPIGLEITDKDFFEYIAISAFSEKDRMQTNNGVSGQRLKKPFDSILVLVRRYVANNVQL